jgi:hypothetical protein
LLHPHNRIPPQNKWKLAAYVRETTGRKLDVALFASKELIYPGAPKGAVGLQEAIDSFPNSVADRMDRVLLNLDRETTHLGQTIKIWRTSHPILMSQNDLEMEFTLKTLQRLEYVDRLGSSTNCQVTLTAKGLKRAADLNRGLFGPLSKTAFVAMSFDKSMDPFWEQGLEPGFKDCGYEPVRVDRREHNGDICDYMIAEIRKSKFMVADFTGQKAGVYFEAGFMMGLGRPVIFTCRADEIEKAHFDTSHYNHVTWDTPADLRAKLKARIEATIVP